MKRYTLPDLLKGFAVFLIIPIHILETFINYTGRESLFGKTLLLLGGPLAVPVFMMVMGYFVSLNKKSPIQNVIRGIKIIIIGFLLNIGLNLSLLIKIEFEGWQFDPLQYIFGVDVLYMAGLSIVILSVLKSLKKGQLWITLFLILFVSISTSQLNRILTIPDRNYFLPFIAGEYLWSYFPLFPWLSYSLIGFLFQKTEQRIMQFFLKHKSVSITLVSVIFVLVVLFSQFGIKTTINLSEYYHHTFMFLLWAVGVDILWIILLRFIVQRFPEFSIIVFLRWLGKNITVFYIIQWLIIGNFATIIYQTRELSQFGYWFGAIFLATIGFTMLYEKTIGKYSLQKSNN
jgi:hypothetical protein